MSTKNKGAPQFSLMHYKLTVVEDAQDQRTVDYTMLRNLRVKEELLSKPKKYINDWVTTVIRGWRNMSFVVTDGGRYMNRAGERRDLQLKQTNPRHGMTAWKNWRCTYLNCRDLNKVIPRDQSSLPMPDFLLKTYLIIYADTIKADNHLNPVLWWKQPNKQNTKTRMFFHLFFFFGNQIIWQSTVTWEHSKTWRRCLHSHHSWWHSNFRERLKLEMATVQRENIKVTADKIQFVTEDDRTAALLWQNTARKGEATTKW